MGRAFQRDDAVKHIRGVSGGNRRSVWNEFVENQTVRLVFVFYAVDDGSPFDGGFSPVVFHFATGFHPAYVHREIQFYRVAFLPFPQDDGVTVFHTELRVLAVDLYGVALSFSGVVIQVGRYRTILCPSRDAASQGKGLLLFRMYGHADFSVPWIIRCLADFYFILGSREMGRTLYI